MSIHLKEIADPEVIVEGHIPFRDPDGESGRFFVRVGRPFAHEGAYCCPLIVEGLFEGVRPIFGVGPVDSLMNAMVLVKRHFEKQTGLASEPLPKFD